MSGSISSSTRRRYGLARVCSAWKMPRSTFYAQAPPAADPLLPPPKNHAKRGPKTALDDDAPLAQLRAAVATFVHLYNHHWRLEKLRFQSPIQARLAFHSSWPLAA